MGTTTERERSVERRQLWSFPTLMVGRALRRLRVEQGATLATILTGFWGQAALVISGPIAARLLGVVDRGHLALLILFPLILAQLGHFGVPHSIAYFTRGNIELVRSMGAQVLRLGILQGLSMMAVHLVILIAYAHDKPRSLQAAAALTIVLVPAHLMQVYGLAMLQACRQFKSFNLLRALSPTMYAIGLLGCLLTEKSDLFAVVVVCVVSAIVSGMVTLYAGLGVTKPADQADQLPQNSQLVKFGLIAYLGAVSPLETFGIDQLIAGLVLSPAALGLYVVGMAFANLPRFVGQSIGMVAYPNVVGEKDPRRAFRALWRYFWVAVALCSVLALGLVVTVGTLIPFFFGSDFAGSIPLARILIVGGLFLSLKRVVCDGLRGVGLGQPAMFAELASWATLVPLLLSLPDLLGVEGVAVSFAGSALVGLSLVLLRARQADHRMNRAELEH